MVACQVGERSGYASAFLERFGFKVAHIRGGFAAWKEAGNAVAVSSTE
jgi:rhodanese-related sulfurtransferase